MRRLLAVLLGISLSLAAYGSDQEREKSHADEIIDMLMVGDEVWLSDGSHDFLALFTEADEAQGKAAILMHGTGAHPNWADVIFPLREGLPEHGWTTLSIQMPIAAREASFDDYLALFPEVPARIDAAIRYLREQEYSRIVLIGHSLGAMMTTHYLANPDHAAVQGFIAIGLSSADVPPVSVPENLSKIRVPMLDLYGSEDLPNVKSTAWVRASASSDNPSFTQVMVEGADHFFRSTNDELLTQVTVWLQTLAEEN